MAPNNRHPCCRPLARCFRLGIHQLPTSATTSLPGCFQTRARVLYADYGNTANWFLQKHLDDPLCNDDVVAGVPDKSFFRMILARFGSHHLGGQLYGGYVEAFHKQREKAQFVAIYMERFVPWDLARAAHEGGITSQCCGRPRVASKVCLWYSVPRRVALAATDCHPLGVTATLPMNLFQKLFGQKTSRPRRSIVAAETGDPDVRVNLATLSHPFVILLPRDADCAKEVSALAPDLMKSAQPAYKSPVHRSICCGNGRKESRRIS